MIRFACFLDADVRLGQFGQPDREVDVRARIIDRPAIAVPFGNMIRQKLKEPSKLSGVGVRNPPK
jgi:hypothetical protein